MKKIIFVLFACLILLTGCSQKITEGEIYEKEFLPEETRTIIIPMIHTNGKSLYTTYVPVTHHYPDRWRISIKSIEKNDDGDYDTADYYTTEEVYNSCEVGDMFSYDENRDRLRRVSNVGGAECKDITIQNIAEKDWKRQQDN